MKTSQDSSSPSSSLGFALALAVLSIPALACEHRMEAPASAPVAVASAAPAGSAGSMPPAAPAGPVHGKYVRDEIKGGTAEIPDDTIFISFTNDGDRPCVLKSFRMNWGVGKFAGSRTCTPSPALTIAPHGAAETTCGVPGSNAAYVVPAASPSNTTFDNMDLSCQVR